MNEVREPSADSERDRRRRRVEKLRWQLRNARRAVAAKRDQWERLSVASHGNRGSVDEVLVWGLLAGGAAGALFVQLLLALVLG